MDQQQFEPSDLFFSREMGFLGCLIRFFTRTIGESRTEVNHVGIVVSQGPLDEIDVVEALSKVKRHRLVNQYGRGRSSIAIFRPLNISEEERRAIVRKAESYVGRRYGYWQLICHLLDWLLLGVFLFRRLGSDRYPICSWVVAYAYLEAGKNFGKPAGSVDPDDIWDFVHKEEHKYKCIRGLAPLK